MGRSIPPSCTNSDSGGRNLAGIRGIMLTYIVNYLACKLSGLHAYFFSAPLVKFPEWKRTIVYPSEALMLGGIRLMDPFGSPEATERWIDGRGRYT